MQKRHMALEGEVLPIKGVTLQGLVKIDRTLEQTEILGASARMCRRRNWPMGGKIMHFALSWHAPSAGAMVEARVRNFKWIPYPAFGKIERA